MSEHLTEIVRANYAAINRQDVDAILRFVHPDVAIIDPSRPDPTSPDGIWHGIEGWGRFLLDWSESFEETRYEPVEIFPEGDDTLIAEVLVRGRGRGSGILVENRRFHVFSFRADKGVRFEVCAERAEAILAAQTAGSAE